MICDNLRRCARLFLDVKCIRRGNKTHNISSCSCSKCFKCVNCVAHSKTLPTHLQIYGTHCAIIGKAGPRKWTIIHINFLIYLHFYYHQPPKTRRRQRKQNEYFISRRFYEDTSGINIYLCNNFSLSSVSLSPFVLSDSIGKRRKASSDIRSTFAASFSLPRDPN